MMCSGSQRPSHFLQLARCCRRHRSRRCSLAAGGGGSRGGHSTQILETSGLLPARRPSLLPAIQEQAALPGLLEAVDPAVGAAQLAAAAATAQAASSALAARQAEALEVVSQELLCSPEIVRCAPGLHTPTIGTLTCAWHATFSCCMQWV